MATTAESIGKRLREARESRDLRPEAVAHHIGVSRDTLDRYEAGKKNPSALQVAKIAQITEYPFGWFALTDEELEIEPLPPEELDQALLAALLSRLDESDRQHRAALDELRRLLGRG